MNYHKTHRKKQFLAMFLTGSLMLSGIPVYAAQDTDMDLSVDTTESDDDFSVSSSDDTNLTVDFDDPETAPDTFEIPDSNSDTLTDFSSENNDALFSSGTDSDSDTEPETRLHSWPSYDRRRTTGSTGTTSEPCIIFT